MRRWAQLLPLIVVALATTGCDRKNNPLLASVSGGVTSTTLAIPQIDTASDNDVNRIFVSVLDNLGNPLTGFLLGNFSILEGGKPGVPFEVGRVTDPLYLALIIDRSGSMAGSNTTAANTAATDLVNALGVSDFAALIEFANDVAVTVDFTTDKSALNTAIATGVASGGTALYDAIIVGAGLLNTRPGRRLLIVLTDGDDTASTSDAAGAIGSVNSAGLSCYPVGLGLFFNAAVLQQIATDTGGTYASSADGTGLSSIFLDILDRFNNLNFIRYRRRSRGPILVYLNYGDITANAQKTLD